MKKINVLSLFDGIRCGMVALERADIEVENYYASEIDKYAIQIADKNYPNCANLGDITKWREWNINWESIDLLLAGFPCQSWSMAGKQGGDNDNRGQLMWVMLDILNHIKFINPKIKFLFENVKMEKSFSNYVNKAIGTEPIMVNSALVSAQNRVRAYWTNLSDISQPSDRNIYLVDILEYGFTDRDKAHCIDANYFKGGNLKSYLEKHRRQLIFDKEENLELLGIYNIARGNNPGGIRNDGSKAPCLSSSKWEYNNLLAFVDREKSRAIIGSIGRTTPREYFKKNQGQLVFKLLEDLIMYRKLLPIECERLQTLPDNYTKGISNTQRYRCIGNGWTVDVIAHILKGMRRNNGRRF